MEVFADVTVEKYICGLVVSIELAKYVLFGLDLPEAHLSFCLVKGLYSTDDTRSQREE